MDSLYEKILFPVDECTAPLGEYPNLEKSSGVALVFICTGIGYCNLYLQPALYRAREFFPADILLFTDSRHRYDVEKQVTVVGQGWPNVSLKRYHTILSEKEWLSKYKYIFHFDVDMKLVRTITTEILADGITVTQQPDFVNGGGVPEEDPRSTACLSSKDIRNYVTGAFQGGESQAFLSMAETISHNIDIDLRNNFMARSFDESHLNRYVYDNPPAKLLPVTYCSKYHKDLAVDYIQCMDETDPLKVELRKKY